MRLKVVAAILLLAFGVLGIAFLIPRMFHHEPVIQASENLPAAQTRTNVSPQKKISIPAPVPAPPVVANTSVITNTLAATNTPAAITTNSIIQDKDHAQHVQQRVAELSVLAMNNDTNSLNTIWSELSNPDKDIRAGALAAVVQFGDHSVSPRLRELAAQTQDPAEQADILQAADYLDLPPITDVTRKQTPARRPGSPPPSH